MDRMRFKPLLLICTLLALIVVGVQTAEAQATRTYTTTADFNRGFYAGTNATTVPDQVGLDPAGSGYEYAWVANSGDSYVVKIDLRTGKAVAGYLTGRPLRNPPHSLTDSDFNGGFSGNVSPSRTAIDRNGDCWVANRAFGNQASVTQIAADGGVDRNGNGVIDTSRDVNGNGIIEPHIPGEMLPWGEDERVIRHYLVGGINGAARALAIGPDRNIYVGLYNEKRIYKLPPDADAPPGGGVRPTPLGQYDVPLNPYGCAFGPNGKLYIGGAGPLCVELDVSTGFQRHFAHGRNTNYGVTVDRRGIVWLGGINPLAAVIRIDPATWPNANSLRFTDVPGGSYGRGLSVDFDGNVWMACSGSHSVAKFDPTGNLLGHYSTNGRDPVGVGIAPNGHILIANSNSLTVTEMLTNGSIVRMMNTGTGPSPFLYTYTDFTGAGTVFEQTGRWRVIQEANTDKMPWRAISWNAQTPEGTSLLVEARAADTLNPDNTVPGGFLTVNNGVILQNLVGRYLEVRVTLQTTRARDGAYPVLLDLTVRGGIPPNTLLIEGPTEGSTACDALLRMRFAGEDDFTPANQLEYQWRLDEGDWSEWSPKTEVELKGLSDALHTFQVRSRDQDGNIDPTPAQRTFLVDDTPPTITDIQIEVCAFGVMVRYQTSEPALTQVEYGICPQMDKRTPLETTPGTEHQVFFRGETRTYVTPYCLRVRAADVCGNEAVSETKTVGFFFFPRYLSLTGKVNLLYSQELRQPLQFQVRSRDCRGVGTDLLTVTLDANGRFRLDNLLLNQYDPTFRYDLAVKGRKWLRKVVPITLSGNEGTATATLIPGDANDDNSVNIFDLATLAEDFNSVPGEDRWNGGRSDFNCDDGVDIFDLAILAEFFNTEGDP